MGGAEGAAIGPIGCFKEDFNHSKQDGAVEACRAHNPEVGGSKPPLAIIFLFCYSPELWQGVNYSLFFITLLVIPPIWDFFSRGRHGQSGIEH